jgi:hypothetical protein
MPVSLRSADGSQSLRYDLSALAKERNQVSSLLAINPLDRLAFMRDINDK